jgi:predicted amidohydrolase
MFSRLSVPTVRELSENVLNPETLKLYQKMGRVKMPGPSLPKLAAHFEGIATTFAAVGLTPAQVFRAATIVNAEALGLNREIGTVQTGKRANLLLLRKDPTQTVDAYADIVKVILRERVIDRVELAANRPAAGAGPNAQ